jgi:hypothetical protein
MVDREVEQIPPYITIIHVPDTRKALARISEIHTGPLSRVRLGTLIKNGQENFKIAIILKGEIERVTGGYISFLQNFKENTNIVF